MFGEGLPGNLLLFITLIGFFWGLFNDKETESNATTENTDGL